MYARALILALVGCHVKALPIVAPAGLDVTMDGSEGGVVIEDDARRHAAPTGMMARRVYGVEASVVRWYPRSLRRPRPGRFAVAPSLPEVPDDRVALRGGPAPLPGQRFVLFDDTGPQGVAEVTGERCPPGHEDCIACAADDPERRHWARIVGSMPNVPMDTLLALGPFAVDDVLPVPRAMDEIADIVKGRWRLGALADLDGDGTADYAAAGPARFCMAPGCPPFEMWRMVAGRWYAEPREVWPRLPFRLLELQLGSDEAPVPAVGDVSGAPWVSLSRWQSEAYEPEPGDYWMLARGGEIGIVRYTGMHIHYQCWSDGDSCHEAQVIAGPEGMFARVVAGPIPAGVGVRSVALPLSFERAPGWWLDVARPEVVLVLGDGRRWTVTSRPCAMVMKSEQVGGVCFEGRENRPGAAPLRWMSGEFSFGHHSNTVPVCRRIDDTMTHTVK